MKSEALGTVSVPKSVKNDGSACAALALSEGTCNSLIVITGDILHNKEILTPLSIELCFDFLTQLSKIMTTIFIPGNHDINIKNSDNHDGLYSILYKRKNTERIFMTTYVCRQNNNLAKQNALPNYYLRESNIYKFNNILFDKKLIIKYIIFIFYNYNNELYNHIR